MSRPSLKITRHDDRRPPGDVTFEVWDPIAARYEPMAALDDGLFRLDDLAERLRLMWVQHDPARTSLKGCFDPADDDGSDCAELRVSSQAKACVSYYTSFVWLMITGAMRAEPRQPGLPLAIVWPAGSSQRPETWLLA